MARDAAEVRRNKGKNAPMTLGRAALLWLLFVLTCLGLGYPALNRYDPTKIEGTSDVGEYRDLVMGREPQRPLEGTGPYARLARWENYSRVLVPYVAKPFYWVAKGRVGTWDPALFGLLMSNAIFTATTVILLVHLGCNLRFSVSTALLGATLYLLNFVVANLNLVGLVDSGEGCFMMAVVWSLSSGRWFLLPVWGVFGALAKETFAPLSVLFAFGWWLSEVRPGRLRLSRLAWIAALGVASLATVTLAMSTVAEGLVWPWQFAANMRARVGFLAGLRGCILDHTFWYVFIWLLPLGVLRVRRLPRPWVLASALAFCGAFAMGAYNNALGNTTRALFNVAGPMLSLSAAIFLADRSYRSAHSGCDETRGAEEHIPC
jgi:hypothetical protein